jgi:L-asparaginase
MQKLPNGTQRPPDDPKDFLRVAPELKEIVDFDFIPLMNKDSTNMNPADWSKIAQAVYERRNNGYHGFVIAHGTDTMHFSASAVAFALGRNLNFPVVFTGAQTIPEVRHGDARVNLLRACKVATMDLAEVVISFGEYIFRGCRAQKKDARRFDAFESPAFYPLGFITDEIIIEPIAKKRDHQKCPDIELKADFEQGVIRVSLIPGLKPELILPVLQSKRCKGVILQAFGAGNVPDHEHYSFTGLFRQAQELHKPVIISSQLPATATLHTVYEPGRAAIKAGAIPIGNMTASCVVAKFMWVLAQVEAGIRKNRIETSHRVERVKNMMQEVYVGEMDV